MIQHFKIKKDYFNNNSAFHNKIISYICNSNVNEFYFNLENMIYYSSSQIFVKQSLKKFKYLPGGLIFLVGRGCISFVGSMFLMNWKLQRKKIIMKPPRPLSSLKQFKY